MWSAPYANRLPTDIHEAMRSPISLARAVTWRLQQWRRSRYPDLERVFFLHLPKCGGTSVDVAMRNAYRGAAHATVHLDPHAADRAAAIAGERERPYRRRLLLYYMAEERNRYISGHFPYSEQARQAFGDEWHYITVLREPVSRWLSNYFYNKYKTSSDFYRITAPIEEFIASERARSYGSNYVQNLTDDTATMDSDGAVEQAIRNLQRFAVVGALERMDTFVSDCDTLLGVDLDVGHHRKNPRTTSEQREEITEGALEQVRELCIPNTRVYNAALARIDEQGSWLTQ